MKYKICKEQDANNTIMYKVQKKTWFGWKNIKIYHQTCLGQGYYEIISFFTFEQAKEWVDREIAFYKWNQNCKKKKVVECVEV